MNKAAGYWREPDGIPSGTLTWLPPPTTGGLKTYVGIVSGKTVATISRRRHGCTVRVPGWMWYPHPDAPDGRMGVKESPVIAFAGVKESKKAVADALALLPVATM